MKKIFQKILNNKDSLLRSKSGSDFEDRFEEYLRLDGYIRLDSTDHKELLNAVKKFVLDKRSDTYIKIADVEELNGLFGNIAINKSYFRVPYGSQQYPDFLVITNNYIVPVEIKYSTNDSSKPMWNSNLPKRNGIYLFGCYCRKDVTFFAGKLIIAEAERDDLLALFEKLSDIVKQFKKDTKAKVGSDENYSLGRGFVPYSRVAFDQSKEYGSHIDINYFDSPDRKAVEEQTIDILSNLE